MIVNDTPVVGKNLLTGDFGERPDVAVKIAEKNMGAEFLDRRTCVAFKGVTGIVVRTQKRAHEVVSLLSVCWKRLAA